jgi:glycosyltransferase involved in cell wall biosynthesis
VLPYRADTSSAVAAVAYHYDKPILATRVEGLSDVVEDGRTGFLVERESPEQIAACLKGLDRGRLGAMHEAVRAFKTRFTWESLAEAMLGLSRQLHEAEHDSPRGTR